MDQATTIMDALRDVYDPCCEDRQLSVVDMGLIEDIHVDDDRAAIDLVLDAYEAADGVAPLVEEVAPRELIPPPDHHAADVGARKQQAAAASTR